MPKGSRLEDHVIAGIRRIFESGGTVADAQEKYKISKGVIYKYIFNCSDYKWERLGIRKRNEKVTRREISLHADRAKKDITTSERSKETGLSNRGVGYSLNRVGLSQTKLKKMHTDSIRREALRLVDTGMHGKDIASKLSISLSKYYRLTNGFFARPGTLGYSKIDSNKLAEKLKEDPKLNNAQLGVFFGVSEGTIRNARKRLNNHLTKG